MSRRNSLLLAILFCLVTSGFALAQDPPGPPPGHEGFSHDGFGHEGFGPPPMERAFHDRQFGRWWKDPRIAQELNLTDQQKQQMDQIFLQHRLKLIDLDANLEKQQVLLGPMIEADQPDETKILAQIDAIAQARADLEKADARMLFDLRKTLTPEQWKKLKSLRAEHRDEMMRRGRGGPDNRDGHGGREMWHQYHHQGLPPNGAGPQGPPAALQGQAPAPPQ